MSTKSKNQPKSNIVQLPSLFAKGVHNNNKRNLVFVYGSLLKGFSNHRLIEKEQMVLPEAKVVSEKLYGLSLGGYPGIFRSKITPKSKLQTITGELYRVSDSCMGSLDMLESNGSYYNREAHTIVPLDGEAPSFEAWVYILMDDYSDRPWFKNRTKFDKEFSWRKLYEKPNYNKRSTNFSQQVNSFYGLDGYYDTAESLEDEQRALDEAFYNKLYGGRHTTYVK